jgi:hypothetical protein
MATHHVVVLKGRIARRRDAVMVAVMRARIPFTVHHFPDQLLWFTVADRYGAILDLVIRKVLAM